MFSWCSFFAFWGAEKHVFHIYPFRSSCYVLKIFGCFVVSNRESKWNRGKNLYSWDRYFKYAYLKYRYSFTNLFRSFVHSHYSFWNLGILFTFMRSPPNDKYNLSYSRTQNSRKLKLHTWFLCFGWCSFFAFWGAENHVYNILPNRSTSYVLKGFGCLEVTNRVSKWNKC